MEHRVSLVIPAHNEEKMLGETLATVQKNAAGKFSEIIVVNNASTDHTAEVARSFPHVRVVTEMRPGTGFARQAGADAATGDIVAFIDADVMLPSGWVERMLAEFDKDSRIVLVSGPTTYDNLSFLQSFFVNVYWCVARIPYLFTGYMAMGGNMAFRRSVLEKMGGFDTSITFYGDDTSAAKRAHKFGKVVFTSRVRLEMSSRRFKNEGFLATSWKYVVNFFKQVFR